MLSLLHVCHRSTLNPKETTRSPQTVSILLKNARSSHCEKVRRTQVQGSKKTKECADCNCVSVCVRACLSACVSVCLRAWVHTT